MARCERGHRLRWGDKFCRVCGLPASTGTTVCGSCGKEVRSSSVFCWNCGKKLAEVAPAQFDTSRWARMPGDFVVRVDVEDVKGWLVKPLVIEHGLRALLFQAGKFVGELESGRYDVGGLAARLSNFMIDRAVSVVLMDAGDVSVDLRNGIQDLDAGSRELEDGVRDLEKGVGDVEEGFADVEGDVSSFDEVQKLEDAPGDLEEGDRYPRKGNLWTADRVEIGTRSQLVIRVGEADTLFVNLIKGRARVTLDDLAGLLAGEVDMLLTGILGRYQSDQLFTNFDVRYEIEAQLRDHLGTTFSRLGLELVQLRFIDFTGPAYELLRKKRGDQQFYERDADITMQRYRLVQRLREAESHDKMHALKDGQELNDFLRQTEHELGLKKVIRDDEMGRLTDRLKIETEDARIRLEQQFKDEQYCEHIIRMIEIQGIQDNDRRERAWKDELGRQQVLDERLHRKVDRWKDYEQARADVGDVWRGTKARDHDEDVREAHHGLDLLDRTKDIEFKDDRRRAELDVEMERQRLEQRSKATAEALISIVDDPAADHLAELEQLRVKQNMSPEQILALAADASPHWAEALAEKYKAEGELDERVRQQLEARIEEQRELGEGQAERLERVTKTALEQMGWVASTRSVPGEPAPVVFPPPGMGGATSINIHSQISESHVTCVKCGATLEAEDDFCPKCGEQRTRPPKKD